MCNFTVEYRDGWWHILLDGKSVAQYELKSDAEDYLDSINS